MNKNKFVNGPINTVRLEGNIGSVKKTIYLFMDFHESVHSQTECDDIRSKDIDKFLVETFDKAEKIKKNIMYDFFVESNPLYPIRRPKGPFRGRYLFEQTEKLIQSSMNIESGKVMQSKEFNNVRFHSADIREYTIRRYDHIHYQIEQLINNIWHSKDFHYDDIIRILDGLKIIDSLIVFLYNLIYKNKNINKPKTKIIFTKDQEILSKCSDEDYKELSENIIYKIMRSYSHADVSQVIKTYINNELHTEFENFFEEMNSIINYLQEVEKKIAPFVNKYPYNQLQKQDNGTYMYGLSNIDQIIYRLNDITSFLWNYIGGGIGLNLMDLYLLRRILDKDYVHNAVVYTGAGHSLNYIRILVKYFDFKITNWSYLKDNDLKNAETVIMNSKIPDDLNELFYAQEKKQCSNLSDFPELLT